MSNCHHTPGMVFVDDQTRVNMWIDLRQGPGTVQQILGPNFRSIGVHCGTCKKALTDNEIQEVTHRRSIKPGFLEWATKPNRSLLDSIMATCFVVSLLNQRWLEAGCFIFIGLFITPALTRAMHGDQK